MCEADPQDSTRTFIRLTRHQTDRLSLSHTQKPGVFACALALLAFAHGCQTLDSATPEASPPVPVHSEPETPVDPPQPAADAPAGSVEIVSARYDRAARYSAAHGGVAMVAVEGDDIVLAVGQNGHSIDAPHPLHNATESFWGVAAIAAEVDGLLDLDEPVSFTLDEFTGARWKEDIRIRQLLWYTSGLEAGVWPLTRENPHNHFARALALESVAPAGVRFQFGPSHLAVFGELLRRKLEPEGLDAVAYLTQRILDPIGLTVSDWRRDAAGNPNLADGATLTATQWAKFGRLLRDGGSWQGETVVDAAELQNCFVGSDVRPDFGLAVWVNPTKSTSDDEIRIPDFWMAAGSGNQRLYVIPSLDLVVVRLGRADRGWRDREFLALLVSAPPSSREASRESPRETRSLSKEAN